MYIFVGLTFLPPRVAAWRYNRGNRSLAANLSAGDGSTSKTSNKNDQAKENDEDDIDVADEVEEVIDQLIQGLRSTDSIVR